MLVRLVAPAVPLRLDTPVVVDRMFDMLVAGKRLRLDKGAEALAAALLGGLVAPVTVAL